MKTRLFAPLAIGLLAFVAVPNATAADLQQTILECDSYTANRDGGSDADTWNACGTPQCGCMCPYAGAGVQVEAAEQERGAFVVVSCQSGYGTQQGTADGGEPVTVFPIVGGGGLE